MPRTSAPLVRVRACQICNRPAWCQQGWISTYPEPVQYWMCRGCWRRRMTAHALLTPQMAGRQRARIRRQAEALAERRRARERQAVCSVHFAYLPCPRCEEERYQREVREAQQRRRAREGRQVTLGTVIADSDTTYANGPWQYATFETTARTTWDSLVSSLTDSSLTEPAEDEEESDGPAHE